MVLASLFVFGLGLGPLMSFDLQSGLSYGTFGLPYDMSRLSYSTGPSIDFLKCSRFLV